MPKWKMGERKFAVSLGYAKKKGFWCTVPMPIVELLGKPEQVVFFVNSNNRIEFRSSFDTEEIEGLNDRK
jgi:hypothetical protein